MKGNIWYQHEISRLVADIQGYVRAMTAPAEISKFAVNYILDIRDFENGLAATAPLTTTTSKQFRRAIKILKDRNVIDGLRIDYVAVKCTGKAMRQSI
jgi:hypothetical protein